MLSISSIRNIKTNLSISHKKKIEIHCRGEETKLDILKKNKHHLEQLININKIKSGENLLKPNQSATSVIKNVEIFLPLKGLIDLNKEIERLNTKINDIKARMDNVKRKLDNSSFIDKAPKKIVEHEKNKYLSYKDDYDKLVANYESITSED